MATHSNWLSERIRTAIDHQCSAFETGANGLVYRQRDGNRIILDNGEIVTPFNSCSYLSLELDSRLIQAACDGARKFGVQFATARTRICAAPIVQMEDLLAQIYFGAPTVTFNSVSSVHLSMLPLLGCGEIPSFPLREGCTWLLDRTAHASIQILRGLMQQFGPVERVDCTDMSALSEAFRQTVARKRTPIVVADSIGSMGGVNPVTAIIGLCELFDGYAYLDDAHGTSVYGPCGCGYVLNELGHFHPRLLLASSLSKGFGATGGAISLPTRSDEEFVRQFATTYVFGGPPSLPGVAAGVASARIHLAGEVGILQARLWRNCALFDRLLPKELDVINRGLRVPIRCIVLGDEKSTIAATSELRCRGYAVTAAMFPTVAQGKAMLRITLTAGHDEQQINDFVRALQPVTSECPTCVA